MTLAKVKVAIIAVVMVGAGVAVAQSGPATQAVAADTRRPTTTPAAVVAEVDGHPIFAGEVLAKVQATLAAKARQLPAAEWQVAAQEELMRAIDARVRDEIVFLWSEAALDVADRQAAQRQVEQYRASRIAEAGGSLEQARQKAQAKGSDFDDEVQTQYEVRIVQQHYRKLVSQRIHITEEDITKFARAHVDGEPTGRDMIRRKLWSDQFRVIKEEMEGKRQAYFAGRVRDYHEHPEMLTPVEEMAMQNYPRWAAGK